MLGPFNTDILWLGESKSSAYKMMMTNCLLFHELFILLPNSSSRVCMGGAECRDEESQARHSESEKCAIMKSA
jgi:hypothetical protein